jgi:hypothetical protein
MKKENPHKTDLDLPMAYRTQANLWKSKYFEMYLEVVKANKGIRRLRKKLDRAEGREKDIHETNFPWSGYMGE